MYKCLPDGIPISSKSEVGFKSLQIAVFVQDVMGPTYYNTTAITPFS